MNSPYFQTYLFQNFQIFAILFFGNMRPNVTSPTVSGRNDEYMIYKNVDSDIYLTHGEYRLLLKKINTGLYGTGIIKTLLLLQIHVISDNLCENIGYHGELITGYFFPYQSTN